MLNRNKRDKIGSVELAIIPEELDDEVDLEDLTDCQRSKDEAPRTEPELHPNGKKKWTRFTTVGILLVVLVIAIVVPLAMRAAKNNEGALPTLIDGGLSEELIKCAHDTVFMTHKLYDEDPTIAIPGATVYVDEPDAALWVKKQDTCFAIFRATTPQLEDWMQNIPLEPAIRFQSPLGKSCTAIDGYHRAYFGTSFVDQFRDDVHDCVDSCGTNRCKLVIGGSSQGAGIATVAAVDLEDLNPILITAGQPPTLVEGIDGPCEAINADRYLRFVNTDMDYTTIGNKTCLHYDMVACMALPNRTDWLGHLFILSDNDGGLGSSLVHYPNYERPMILPTLWHGKAHLMVNYLPRLEKLVNASSFPIPINGWVDGSLCNVDRECQSEICRERECIAAGSNGAPCENDSECVSGRCDGALNAVCKNKLHIGAWCNEDSDCLSNSCSMSKCRE